MPVLYQKCALRPQQQSALPSTRASHQASEIASTTRGQTAEARKTTILQPVEQKPHTQKDRQDEKAEGYIPDEGTRKNPRKRTK